MSVSHIALAWATGVPPIDRLVLVALADWADRRGRCWPSIPQLAAKTGAHERTVRSAISRLEAGGHLTRESVVGRGTRYQLTLCDSSTPGVALTPSTPGGEPGPRAENPPPSTPGGAPAPPGGAPTNTSAIRQERKKTSSSPSTRAAVASVGTPGDDLPALPTGVTDQQWSDFTAMRVAMSKANRPRPWTAGAARTTINDLTRLAAAGHDPGAVLDQSVQNGWQGVFPLKDDHHGRRTNNGGRGGASGSYRDRPVDGFIAALRDVQARGGADDDRGG